VVEQQLSETRATKLGSHIHPLDLSIFSAKQLDATTASGSAAIANDKEGHGVGNQLLHAEAVTTLARIERLQLRLKLRN
jgi:hypothetical protein